MVVAGLNEPRVKIEIEVTAFRGVTFLGHRRGRKLRSRLDQGGVEVHGLRQRELS